MPNLIYKEMMVKCPHCKLDQFAYAPSMRPHPAAQSEAEAAQQAHSATSHAFHSHARFYICLNCGNIIMFGKFPDNIAEWSQQENH